MHSLPVHPTTHIDQLKHTERKLSIGGPGLNTEVVAPALPPQEAGHSVTAGSWDMLLVACGPYGALSSRWLTCTYDHLPHQKPGLPAHDLWPLPFLVQQQK